MRKNILFFAACLCLSWISGFSQDYAVSLVPDSLKENAHCVIREYSKILELQSVNNGVERIKKVITILDKEGEDQAYLAIHYDENSTVSIKQITLFAGDGKRIRIVKLSEIADGPAYSQSLYADDRLKFFKPTYAEYPYSIEYNYERNSTNLISYGCWRPIDDYNISVQHAKLTIAYPISVIVNKKEINIALKSSITQNDNKTEEWEISNIKAIEDEPFDVSLSERIPQVYLMPYVLKYNRNIGEAKDWQSYGKWVFDLYAGRDMLSESEKLRITSLLQNIPDTLARIQALYNYLQQNTRYVSIQLGIGGYQPFSSQTVAETGYGDCKALSNYMATLLKLTGVKSYPAWVSSGKYIEPIFKDFPNFSQFDHVILCVPYHNDTIWLECTSQKSPFGFLGDFADDRDVLLITENGGVFAHTPKYDALTNSRKCNAHFTIDSLGLLQGTMKTTYEGLQYDDTFEFLSLNYDEQKKWLYENSLLPALQIINFTVGDYKSQQPVAVVEESLISKNYGSFSGNYMLLPLNLINAQKSVQKGLKKRFSDIVVSRSYIDYDTLTYEIPRQYKFDALPKGVILNSKFGEYVYSVSVNQNEISYCRKFLIKQGRYNALEYKALYDFILAISKADNIKVMLSKKM
jgi:hypothetical protein